MLHTVIVQEAVEQVSTLFEESIAPGVENTSTKAKLTKNGLLYCAAIGNKINDGIEVIYKYFKKHFYKKINTRVAATWAFSSVMMFSVTAGVIVSGPLKVVPQKSSEYFIYSTKPLTLEQTTNDVYAKDSRSQKINEVFRHYKCPLEGMGEVFVHEADKNNIPWWIVAAISFQESGCGKKTPQPDGVESYNAWGWAIYEGSTHGFDNWARGVETVSKYMGERFFAQGITNTCDIMKVYTPPSKGSWCEGVNYFGDVIQNYTSPDAL